MSNEAYVRASERARHPGGTLSTHLSRQARERADAPALLSGFQGRGLSYGELDREVDLVAGGLIASGLRRGDRVALWSPNRLEWIVVQLAVARAGMVLVSLNPAYQESEAGFVLAHSGARMLIASQAWRSVDHVAIAAALRPRLPALEHVVHFGTAQWDELCARGAGVPVRGLDGTGADVAANIQYTSGTTGVPKGVTLGHRHIVSNGAAIGDRLGLSARDRVCVTVPLFHSFGIVCTTAAALCSGAALVLPADSFNVEATLRTVEEERCTVLHGVPTMFLAALEHRGDRDLSSLRTGVIGGAPCPPELITKVRAHLRVPELTAAFGMTETTSVTTQTSRDDADIVLAETVGRPLPGLEVKIVRPDGATARIGERGELRVRGYSVMLGYWNDPGRTSEVIDGEGWLATGDLGEIDMAGNVRIVGRIKDMVCRGGENIYPAELERLLSTHPDILEAQVVGVPDERLGEAVLAALRVRPDATLDAEAVREWCRARIARFKVPAHVVFVSAFPMTASGKIQKFRIRDDFLARRASAINSAQQLP